MPSRLTWLIGNKIEKRSCFGGFFFCRRMTRPFFTLASPIYGGGGPRKWWRGPFMDTPFGPRVLKGLKFDTAFGREGCGGRPSKRRGASLYKTFTTGLRPWEKRKPYNRPSGEGNAPPLWWLAPPPLPRWEACHWIFSRPRAPYESSSLATPRAGAQ